MALVNIRPREPVPTMATRRTWESGGVDEDISFQQHNLQKYSEGIEYRKRPRDGSLATIILANGVLYLIIYYCSREWQDISSTIKTGSSGPIERGDTVMWGRTKQRIDAKRRRPLRGKRSSVCVEKRSFRHSCQSLKSLIPGREKMALSLWANLSMQLGVTILHFFTLLALAPFCYGFQFRFWSWYLSVTFNVFFYVSSLPSPFLSTSHFLNKIWRWATLILFRTKAL